MPSDRTEKEGHTKEICKNREDSAEMSATEKRVEREEGKQNIAHRDFLIMRSSLERLHGEQKRKGGETQTTKGARVFGSSTAPRR